jgi:hypothetical protein
MFVRVHCYDSIGWPGSSYIKDGRRVTPRLHARGATKHYPVIEAVRTSIGPRQRTVASWTGTPSLAAAIDAAHTAVAEAAARVQWLRETGRDVRPDAQSVLRREYLAALTKRDRCARRLMALEYAHAALGDWMDREQ